MRRFLYVWFECFASFGFDLIWFDVYSPPFGSSDERIMGKEKLFSVERVPCGVRLVHPGHLFRFWTVRIWKEKKKRERGRVRGKRMFQSESSKKYIGRLRNAERTPCRIYPLGTEKILMGKGTSVNFARLILKSYHNEKPWCSWKSFHGKFLPDLLNCSQTQ